MTVQPYQGRTNSYAAGTSGTRANTARTGGRTSGQQQVVKCFNCQREGHMARQCTQPKRKRDVAWFKEKVLLVEAQGMGKVVQDTNASAQQDAMILSVIEQMSVKVTDITKVNEEHLNANKSLSAGLERYKERVALLEERQNMDLSTREKLIIDDVIREKLIIQGNQFIYIINWRYVVVLSGMSLVESLQDQILVIALSFVTLKFWGFQSFG